MSIQTPARMASSPRRGVNATATLRNAEMVLVRRAFAAARGVKWRWALRVFSNNDYRY